MDIKKLIYDGVSKVAYNEARKNISDSACLFLHYQPVCPDGVKKMVQANTNDGVRDYHRSESPAIIFILY